MKNDRQTGSSIWRRHFLDKNASSLILLIALILGLLVWTADAALDYFVFYESGFLDLLFLSPPQHEIYIRFLILLCFLCFGGVVAAIVLNLQDTRNELQNKETNLRTTLQSIGDAVIATDTRGRIQRMNERSESLTGWDLDEAQGLPLERVFRIVNAFSREPVANPVQRVLEEGTIQGLANHTVLIAKDGSEYQIADSASPIRSDEGSITGVVLVFRDVTEQYRQEELLRKQRRRLANVIEGTDAGIWERNIQTLEFFFDVFWLQHLGYDPDEFSEMDLYSWRELLHPEDLEKSDRLIAEHLSGRLDAYECEIRVRRREGSWAWVLDRGKVMELTSDGEPLLLSGTVQDITARKQAKEAIENERAYLSAVIDNIGEAIVICDAEGRIARFNETARRLHGLPEEPIPADQWAEHFDLYQVDGITPLPIEDIPLFRALQGERVQNAEIVVAPKHSRPYYLICSGQALTDETGQITGAVVAMHDITERKRMEERLRRERDLSQRYLDTTQTMMVAMDEEGRISMINRSGRELLGYAEEEILGCNWFETCLPHPEGMDSVYPVFQTIMDGDLASVEYFENSVVCKDGTQRLMGWHNAFLEDDAGRVVGILGSGEDITERRQAEEALRESEQRFKQWFESSPISLWEQDFSAVKKRIDEIKAQNVGDLDSYFRQRLELVWELAGMVRVLDINQASLKLYRAKSKEEFFDGITKVFSRESLEGFLQVLQVIAAGEKTFVTEKEHVILHGDPLKIQLYWTVAKGHEETYSRILVSIVDITQRKRAEEALRQSESYYRTIFETSGSAMLIIEEDTTISLASSNFEELSGYSKHEIEGKKSWTEFVHPDDVEWMKENHYLRRRDSHAAPRNYEFRFLDHNGAVRHGYLTVGMIPDTT
ncbi:MAG: PAS domain S-box protein, partial [Desulfohalobiaceae bacterium]